MNLEFILVHIYTEVKIIWIPSIKYRNQTSYCEDILQILDGIVKVHEINAYHNRRFRVGLATN